MFSFSSCSYSPRKPAAIAACASAESTFQSEPRSVAVVTSCFDSAADSSRANPAVISIPDRPFTACNAAVVVMPSACGASSAHTSTALAPFRPKISTDADSASDSSAANFVASIMPSMPICVIFACTAAAPSAAVSTAPIGPAAALIPPIPLLIPPSESVRPSTCPIAPPKSGIFTLFDKSIFPPPKLPKSMPDESACTCTVTDCPSNCSTRLAAARTSESSACTATSADSASRPSTRLAASVISESSTDTSTSADFLPSDRIDFSAPPTCESSTATVTVGLFLPMTARRRSMRCRSASVRDNSRLCDDTCLSARSRSSGLPRNATSIVHSTAHPFRFIVTKPPARSRGPNLLNSADFKSRALHPWHTIATTSKDGSSTG